MNAKGNAKVVILCLCSEHGVAAEGERTDRSASPEDQGTQPIVSCTCHAVQHTLEHVITSCQKSSGILQTLEVQRKTSFKGEQVSLFYV